MLIFVLGCVYFIETVVEGEDKRGEGKRSWMSRMRRLIRSGSGGVGGWGI
jgi:hypothetical protein